MSRLASISGVVTHIQRFSVHDGPGIRTTVFLKGCQMHCPWCHNPETVRPQPELQVFAQRCIGCGACLEQCAQHARRLVDGRMVFDRERCVACGRCVEVCYAQSLVLVGQTKTAGQVADEVLADRAFYQSSGGGVTISGGEPLAQPHFTQAILELCKAEEIHTAVETNLGWPWSTIARLLPAVDLFLVDIKLLDDTEHRTWTGMSNQHTLDNLRRLDAEGKPIVVRTPVVSRVNDRADQIAAIADFLAGLSHVRAYELLPYHPLGTGKYEALGLAAPWPRFQTPTAEQLRQLAAAAQRPTFEVCIAGSAAARASNPPAPLGEAS
jgi:pyruvate formate lyase activating enzyme